MSHLYDTHLHLDLFPQMDEIIETITRDKIYTLGVTNLPPLYLKLRDKINNKYIRIALGFHPELLNRYKHYIPVMWELLPDCKYIGEVGLDYKSGENRALQKSFFEELIHKCDTLQDRILSVHTRNSAADAISIIGNHFRGSVILHWFSGKQTDLSRAINQGNYFSINYAMCISKKGEELILKVPKERILLETDAPFVRYNNSNFTPQYIPEIIHAISKTWGDDFERTKDQLWANFKKLLQNTSSTDSD